MPPVRYTVCFVKMGKAVQGSTGTGPPEQRSGSPHVPRSPVSRLPLAPAPGRDAPGSRSGGRARPAPRPRLDVTGRSGRPAGGLSRGRRPRLPAAAGAPVGRVGDVHLRAGVLAEPGVAGGAVGPAGS